MNYRCRIHDQADKSTCSGCHPEYAEPRLTVETPGLLEEHRARLAHQLAIFLGCNEVETYVSPGGYKLKLITIRQPSAAVDAPWHQVSKQEAA